MFNLRDVIGLMATAFILGIIFGNIIIPFIIFKVIGKRNKKVEKYIDKASKAIKEKD